MKKVVTVNREGLRPVIGIIDNRGLTFVGNTDFSRDEQGMFTLFDAQCIIKWWTGAHLGHLVNGVCEGVELGAKHTVKIKEFYIYFELPMKIETWKKTKIKKGSREVM